MFLAVEASFKNIKFARGNYQTDPVPNINALLSFSFTTKFSSIILKNHMYFQIFHMKAEKAKCKISKGK